MQHMREGSRRAGSKLAGTTHSSVFLMSACAFWKLHCLATSDYSEAMLLDFLQAHVLRLQLTLYAIKCYQNR
jgi:hypothetical protein